MPLESIQLPEGLTYIGRQALGAYVYNSDYTAQYWAGPTYVELNGALKNLGYNAFRPDAEIVAVLNSQRNLVVASSDLEKLPTVDHRGQAGCGSHRHPHHYGRRGDRGRREHRVQDL